MAPADDLFAAGRASTSTGKSRKGGTPAVTTPTLPTCPAGEIYNPVTGRCEPIPLPPQCDAQGKCPTGYICDPATNYCVELPKCGPSGECDPGFVCENSYCIPELPQVAQSECDAANPCPTGLKCDGGSCVPSRCDVPSDCPTNFECDSDFCVPASSWKDRLKVIL